MHPADPCCCYDANTENQTKKKIPNKRDDVGGDDSSDKNLKFVRAKILSNNYYIRLLVLFQKPIA